MPSQKDREGGAEPVVLNVIPALRWLLNTEWVRKRLRRRRSKTKEKKP